GHDGGGQRRQVPAARGFGHPPGRGRSRVSSDGARRTVRQARTRGGAMNELLQRLSDGTRQLAAVVPSFLAAALILIAGYFVARLIERVADQVLKRLNFNKVAEAGGLS